MADRNRGPFLSAPILEDVREGGAGPTFALCGAGIGDGQAVRHRAERRRVGAGRAAPAGGTDWRAAASHEPARGGQRDLLPAADRLPVGPSAPRLTAPAHG